MKRILFIILSLMLLLCACGGNDIAVNDLEGIRMEVSGELSNRAAAISISVDVHQRFAGTGEFFIQQLKNGKWRDVGDEKGISSALREDFGRGEVHSFYCVWEDVCGPLEQGHYRIVKEIYVGAKAGVGQLHYLAAEFYIGPEQIVDKLWVRDEAPYVSVISGGETVIPFFHVTFAYDWDGELGGWISADGSDIICELQYFTGELPKVRYTDGFEPQYNRNSSFNELFIYDENYELISIGTDFSALDELEPGKYYVGIHVTVQGEYIPAGNDRERSGVIAVVVLEKQ